MTVNTTVPDALSNENPVACGPQSESDEQCPEGVDDDKATHSISSCYYLYPTHVNFDKRSAMHSPPPAQSASVPHRPIGDDVDEVTHSDRVSHQHRNDIIK